MSCKSDRVRCPTDKAAALPVSKGSRSQDPKGKAPKSKKQAQSPVEDDSQSDMDSSGHARTSKRLNGKQQQAKRAHRSLLPDADVETEELDDMEEIELIEVSLRPDREEPMDDETDDEDCVSIPINQLSVY